MIKPLSQNDATEIIEVVENDGFSLDKMLF